MASMSQQADEDLDQLQTEEPEEGVDSVVGFSHPTTDGLPKTGPAMNVLATSSGIPKTETVMVDVRVRPLSESEVSNNQQCVWDVATGDGGTIALSAAWRDRLRKTTGINDFAFDHVYTGSDNNEIYGQNIRNLVVSTMEGYNGTVFAYGQTCSGKTYTMMGTPENWGIIPRAVEDVFAYISSTEDQREFLLRVSYLEIYNEAIRDLLCPENDDLKIHEDKQRGVYVSPLREEIVTSPDQVLQVIQRGEANRHVSSTDYNEHSSRSHTMFQIVVESRDRSSASPQPSGSRDQKRSLLPVRISTLNLIDLAGSEKASVSADRRREGAYINRSLLTLGTVIARLTDVNVGHVPYRDSKLTRILQPSLQGAARVSVICTISPAMNNFEETVNTLKFAQRIKKVITRARTTEIVGDEKALLQRYRSEINDLKNKLTNLSDKESQSSQLAAEKMRLEEELSQQQLVRTALKERIDHLTKLILTSSSFNTQAILNTWQVDGGTDSAPGGSNVLVTHPAGAIGESRALRVRDRLNLSSSNMELNFRPIPDKKVDALQEENRKLKQTISVKDHELRQLREELLKRATVFPTPSITPLPTAEMTTQVAQLRDQLEERNKRIRELEALVARVNVHMPVVLEPVAQSSRNGHNDADRLMELIAEVDKYRDKVDELEAERKDSQRTILSLTADVDRLQRSHVPKNASSTERHAQQTQRSPIFEASTPGSHRHQAEAYSPVMPIDDNVDTPNDEPLSPNARLLSSLLTSRNGDASSRSQAGANMESGGSTRSTAHVSPPAVKSTRAASTEQLIEKLEQSLNITGSDTDDGDTVADDRWQRRANRDRGTTSVLGHIYSSGSLYQPSLSDRTAEVHSSGGSEFMSQKTASTTVAEHTTDQSLVPRSNAIAKSKDSLYSASEELQRYLQRLESNVD